MHPCYRATASDQRGLGQPELAVQVGPLPLAAGHACLAPKRFVAVSSPSSPPRRVCRVAAEMVHSKKKYFVKINLALSAPTLSS